MIDTQPTDAPYTVQLADAPTVPPALRMAAEIRFAKTIERQLGGPAEVVSTLQAWRAAEESDPQSLSAEDRNLAVRWPKAFKAANDAGFDKLGDLDGAHFDVRVV
jgi:hypothetical protein